MNLSHSDTETPLRRVTIAADTDIVSRRHIADYLQRSALGRRFDIRHRSSSHGGTFCQESVVGWPGDLLWAAGLGVRTVLAFLAAAGFVPPRDHGSSWSARSGSARQGAGEDERA
jgi:hypothetical protein